MLERRTTRAFAAAGAAALTVPALLATPASAGHVAPPSGTEPVLVTGQVTAPLQLAVSPSGHTLYSVDGDRVVAVDLRRPDSRTVTLADGLGFAAGITVRGGQVFVTRSAEGAGPFEQGPTSLSRITRRGGVVDVADLLAVERAENPDQQVAGGDAESNPYDVVAYRGGFVVVDAAANALFRVSPNGDATTLTAFPNITSGECAGQPNQGTTGCDAVPTGIDLGPDGLLYVSGLGGFVDGQIWVVDPRTGVIVDTVEGPPVAPGVPVSPPLTDIVVADDGTVYVSSIFLDRVYRLQDGVWTSAEVEAPAGLAVAGDVLYVGSAPATLAFESPDAPSGPPPAGAVYAVPEGAFS